MEVSPIQFESMRWVIYDYGGQQIYHVNHSTHLTVPNSIYVVVLATCAFVENTGKQIEKEYELDEITESYEYWLKFINSTTTPIHCITVINFASAFSKKQELTAKINKTRRNLVLILTP